MRTIGRALWFAFVLAGASCVAVPSPRIAATGPARAPQPAPLVKGVWYPGYPELDVGQGIVGQLAEDWIRRNDEKGINVFGWLAYAAQGNPVGGLEQTVAGTGLFNFGAQFDMGKLAGWDDGFFHVSASWGFGNDLSRDIGSFVEVNGYSGDAFRFYELYYDHSWADGAWSVRAGRFSVGWEYGLDYDIFSQYLSAAFDLNVFALDANDLNFTPTPFANWGVRLRWASERWRLQASVTNGSQSNFIDRRQGQPLGYRIEDGVFSIVEGAHVWGNEGGRPGRLAVGAYYDTATFNALDGSGASADGLYMVYAIVRQEIANPSGQKGRAVNAWTAVAYGGRREITAVPWFWSGGLVWFGPLDARKADSLAFGFATSWFSDALQGMSYETTLELSYSFVLDPRFTIAPDLQYLIRPGGTGQIANAFVLGVAAYLTF